MTLMVVEHNSVNIGELAAKHDFQMENLLEQVEVLRKYGWITISGNDAGREAQITDEGWKEILTFSDLAYGRMK